MCGSETRISGGVGRHCLAGRDHCHSDMSALHHIRMIRRDTLGGCRGRIDQINIRGYQGYRGEGASVNRRWCLFISVKASRKPLRDAVHVDGDIERVETKEVRQAPHMESAKLLGAFAASKQDVLLVQGRELSR